MTHHVILTSGEDIYIDREECDSCSTVFVVVRTPPNTDVEMPCPRCEPDKLNILANALNALQGDRHEGDTGRGWDRDIA
jgi:hypothetical protein